MRRPDKVMLLLAVVMAGLLLGAQAYPPDGGGGGVSFPLEAATGCSPPEYGFTGDPNTGMCSSAADTLDFIAGGAGVAGMQLDRAVWSVTMFNNAGDAKTQWTFTNSIGQTTFYELGPGAIPWRLTTHNGAQVSIDIDGNFIFPAASFVSLAFLTPANGGFRYCSDCLRGSVPCSGASTGAFAKRENGAWNCD